MATSSAAHAHCLCIANNVKGSFTLDAMGCHAVPRGAAPHVVLRRQNRLDKYWSNQEVFYDFNANLT